MRPIYRKIKIVLILTACNFPILGKEIFFLKASHEKLINWKEKLFSFTVNGRTKPKVSNEVYIITKGFE